MSTENAPAGYQWVYCKSFKHWRTKKDVYRKDGGFFRFLVRQNKR